MGNIFSANEQEKQVDTSLITSAFTDVIHSYVWFLRRIVQVIQNLGETTDDLNTETSTFNAVKNELFDFLIQHKKFYKTIDIVSKGEVLLSLDTNYLGNNDRVLKLEDVIKLVEELEKDPETIYHTDKVEAEIIKTLEYKLGKSVITNEDILQFLENHFLVDKGHLGTEFSNYKQLTDNIDSRLDNYYDGKELIEGFGNVINIYLWFLTQISLRIFDESTDDLNRETRKFNAVKKELLNFLIQHTQFYKLRTISLVSDDEILFRLDVNHRDNIESSLKLDDVVEFAKECQKYPEPTFNSRIYQVEAEIFKTVKSILNKSVITNEDIRKFPENRFLVDKDNIGTKFSSYKQLEDYIDSRVESYIDRKVSTTHIENIAFNFQGSIKGFEDEKSCAVCLEDYEEDQEVCRLPCNHFCCRNCTEKMFAVPQNGSKAYFQCPICRGDCT